MELGLAVAQSAGAAAVDLARTGEPFVERRPCQDGAGGLGRSPRRAGESFLSPGTLVTEPARPFCSPFPGGTARPLPSRTSFVTPAPGFDPGVGGASAGVIGS